MSRASRAFCAFVVVGLFLLALSARPGTPEPEVPAARRNANGWVSGTERHRAPLPELRIARSQGSPQTVTFWVHVDHQGNVIEVRKFKTDASWPLRYSTEALVEAVRNITDQPFLRSGVAAGAWVQDEVEVGAEPAPSLLSGGGRLS